MAQLNMNVTPEFEQKLAELMKLRGIPTKSEAIRTAVEEALASAAPRPPKTQWKDMIGILKPRPGDPPPRFVNDADLWDKTK